VSSIYVRRTLNICFHIISITTIYNGEYVMYDVIVLGGGPGGYAAGIRASQLGGKVALVESAEMGGTCVNRGCIPSKVWLRAAYFKQTLAGMNDFGIAADMGSLDISKIVERKNGVSNDIKMGMNGLCESYGIDVVKGLGSLKSPREVIVDGKVLETQNIILATGSSIRVPELPGLSDVLMTTDQFFDMAEIPGAVLINGAEHMEVELASLLTTFGAKVTMLAEKGRILTGEDGDTSQRVAQALRQQGVEILSRYQLASIESAGEGFSAALSGPDEKSVPVDRVLITSRKPNSDEIGLNQVGVACDEKGFVTVNETLGTNIEGVYAIGDVTGGRMLSHGATYMGVSAAEGAMGNPEPFPFHLVPRGLFSIPEVGAVGYSEEEAEDMDYDVETGDFPFSINGVAMAYGELEGAVKIVADAEFGEILGVHIVGGRATELIGTAVLAMKLEATADDLARTIMIHPTFSESLSLAAQDVSQSALYLPKR
jgi:dihydrolipoamide dehydrogenase